MAKYLIASVLVLALAAPAGATVHVTHGTNPQAISITLNIPCFTNIYWNDPGSSDDGDDQAITFNDLVQDGTNNGDWYRATSDGLTGAYGNATKSSQDAFAEGYYESHDAALFWLDTNCDATMTATSGGNLSNGSATLPTWYTAAFTNNTGCTWNVDCGFIDAGSRDPCGTIPMDGQGCYGDDDTSPTYAMEFTATDGAAFYPSQYSFPMDDGSPTVYTAGFSAHAPGTILFPARALRSGMSDPSGNYTTSLTIGF